MQKRFTLSIDIGLELTILKLAATRMRSSERLSSQDLYILDQPDVTCRTLEFNTNHLAYRPRNDPGHGVNCHTHGRSGPRVCEHAGLLPPHLDSQCALQGRAAGCVLTSLVERVSGVNDGMSGIDAGCGDAQYDLRDVLYTSASSRSSFTGRRQGGWVT